MLNKYALYEVYVPKKLNEELLLEAWAPDFSEVKKKRRGFFYKLPEIMRQAPGGKITKDWFNSVVGKFASPKELEHLGKHEAVKGLFGKGNVETKENVIKAFDTAAEELPKPIAPYKSGTDTEVKQEFAFTGTNEAKRGFEDELRTVVKKHGSALKTHAVDYFEHVLPLQVMMTNGYTNPSALESANSRRLITSGLRIAKRAGLDTRFNSRVWDSPNHVTHRNIDKIDLAKGLAGSENFDPRYTKRLMGHVFYTPEFQTEAAATKIAQAMHEYANMGVQPEHVRTLNTAKVTAEDLMFKINTAFEHGFDRAYPDKDYPLISDDIDGSYKEHQARFTQGVLDTLDRKFPGMSKHIEKIRGFHEQLKEPSKVITKTGTGKIRDQYGMYFADVAHLGGKETPFSNYTEHIAPSIYSKEELDSHFSGIKVDPTTIAKPPRRNEGDVFFNDGVKPTDITWRRTFDDAEVEGRPTHSAGTARYSASSNSFTQEHNIPEFNAITADINHDGKKILFVHEIQSDFHQKASMAVKAMKHFSKKYGSNAKVEDLLGMEDADTALDHMLGTNNGKLFPRFDAEDDKYRDHLYEGFKHAQNSPKSSFAKNWREKGLQHIIHHAKEKGYSHIMIAPGSLQYVNNADSVLAENYREARNVLAGKSTAMPTDKALRTLSDDAAKLGSNYDDEVIPSMSRLAGHAPEFVPMDIRGARGHGNKETHHVPIFDVNKIEDSAHPYFG